MATATAEVEVVTRAVPYSVLVVEDDPEQSRALELLLSPAFRVRVAGTAADAQRELELCPPDSMLLDLRLPNGVGCALVRGFRLRHKHLPIVVYTAGDFDTEELIGAGGDSVLRKATNDLEDIKHELVQAIARRRAAQLTAPVETHLDAAAEINRARRGGT